MPLFYLRHLTGSKRSETANRHLARFLAFIAGAVNAGGLLAVRQYTSHMSGIISAMADNLAVGSLSVVLDGLGAVGAFLAGAFFTTLMIRWARAHALDSEYALPLMVEAALLVLFGFTGRVYESGRLVLGTVMLLCFTMGLQNAIITKISGAVIRTTHLTGMVTDIGISLGRVASPASYRNGVDLQAELTRLRLHSSLVALFFTGGFTGAIGFRHLGFLFTVPLAAILVFLAAMPVLDDLRRYGHTPA
jgi:uncharacterized membrane protein YoaK (UPF0700 family)